MNYKTYKNLTKEQKEEWEFNNKKQTFSGFDLFIVGGIIISALMKNIIVIATLVATAFFYCTLVHISEKKLINNK